MMHGGLLKKSRLFAALVIILVAAHVIVFYHVVSRMTWGIVLALALLILLKHIGIFGPIYALFKRRSRFVALKILVCAAKGRK